MSLASPPLQKLDFGVWHSVFNKGELLQWLDERMLSAGEEGPVTLRAMASLVDDVLELEYKRVYSRSDLKPSPLGDLADTTESISFSLLWLHSDLIDTAAKVRPEVESRAWLEKALPEVRRSFGFED